MKRLSCKLALLVASCAFAAVPSFAGSPAFLLLDVPLDMPSTAQATCTSTPYSGGSSLVWVGGDFIQSAYFFVSPDICTNCNQGVIQISSIEYGERTVNGQPCTYTVEVSVVGATADPCPVPDESVVVCAPSEVQVTIQPSLSAVMVPLPTTCCLSQDAFIRLRFVDTSACSDGLPHPIFFTGAQACASCDEYFTTSTNYPGLTDVCSVFGNNFWYRVSADCCETVKSEQKTWGGVKSRYR